MLTKTLAAGLMLAVLPVQDKPEPRVAVTIAASCLDHVCMVKKADIEGLVRLVEAQSKALEVCQAKKKAREA